MPDRADRIRGAIFGMAYGDAFAAPTEFALHTQIIERWPPAGPTDLSERPYVTDDTEMALAVGLALEHTAAASPDGAIDPDRLAAQLSRAFVDWSKATDHHRAPGRTCLSACANLAAGKPWVEATIARSKGCGANMRVQPVALLDLPRHGLSDADRGGIAQLQAAITHGHPTGLTAADLTATAIAFAADDEPLTALVPRLRAYADQHHNTYHERWLGNLWSRSEDATAAAFIAHGYAVSDNALACVAEAARNIDHWRVMSNDPCEATGEGWIAEEAMATALLCVLAFPDDPVGMLQRAAVTGGDSDSIACIAGAIAGAHHGLSAWPAPGASASSTSPNSSTSVCSWPARSNPATRPSHTARSGPTPSGSTSGVVTVSVASRPACEEREDEQRKRPAGPSSSAVECDAASGRAAGTRRLNAGLDR